MKLFQSNIEIVTTETLIDQLSPHILKGDSIYAQFDVMRFGRLYDPHVKKEALLAQIFSILLELVGPTGNILVPTFSYSWGITAKEKFFDVRNTKSQVGIFPEYFRQLEGVLRTLDPMFSVGVYGKDKEYFLDIKNNSHGPGSCCHKMHQRNVKLVSFGTRQFDPNFGQYLEQYYDEHFESLGYREIKKFEGEWVNYTGKRCSSSHEAFVRRLDSNYIYKDDLIIELLKKENKINIIQIGDAEIMISDCQSFFQVGLEGLKRDKLFFYKEGTDANMVLQSRPRIRTNC